jgi:polyhydroxybutyrate depolymerase
MIHKTVTIILMASLLALSACRWTGREMAAGAPTPAAAPAGTGSFDASLSSSGVTRHYRLHVPALYRPGQPAPLVVNLHGLGADSREQEALSNMSAKADAEGFIVVYPDGIDHRWAAGPGAESQADRRFIRDLVQQLQQQYTLDPQRIYATGISNGGGMTNRLGCDLADVIAAIAPVEGAYNFWQTCAPSRPMPVLAFHGTADTVVPYEGTGRGDLAPPIREWAAAWAKRDGCAAQPAITLSTQDVTGETWENCQGNATVVLYTIEKHGHGWPGSRFLPQVTSQAINATDVMWDFFKAHPKL